MNLLMAFVEYEILFGIRRKIILQQLHEIRQLAQDLNIDNIQLRKMILESVADIGVSESWLRKLLPENLKLTKHTRKDYLEDRTTGPATTTATAATTKGISRVTIIIISTFSIRTTTTGRRNIHSTRISSTIR